MITNRFHLVTNARLEAPHAPARGGAHPGRKGHERSISTPSVLPPSLAFLQGPKGAAKPIVFQHFFANRLPGIMAADRAASIQFQLDHQLFHTLRAQPYCLSLRNAVIGTIEPPNEPSGARWRAINSGTIVARNNVTATAKSLATRTKCPKPAGKGDRKPITLNTLKNRNDFQTDATSTAKSLFLPR